MTREIPIADRPLWKAEKATVARLSQADLDAIDAIVLANCASHWRKVATVVVCAEKDFASQNPELFASWNPGLSDLFLAQRIRQLAAAGRLESQGDLLYQRFSEVRLPAKAKPRRTKAASV